MINKKELRNKLISIIGELYVLGFEVEEMKTNVYKLEHDICSEYKNA